MANDSAPHTPSTGNRISARIGAIAESATLAVDAKAKALIAAGRPVIGFGAGELFAVRLFVTLLLLS